VAADHTLAIFAAELVLLLVVGRLLGEAMTRIGQPALFGQLLAGVLLGPSVFGALLPDLHHVIFPGTPVLKTMIEAISQIGILLLLLLTGMEADLSLLSRKRTAVVSASLFGIAVPFACGVALAYALPHALIPSHATRLAAALFLGTALSISSVKIVAMVLMEVGAIRRDLGQLILATAILDDTLAWVIIAVISGIAAHGIIEFRAVSMSLALTALFLALSLTVGRRVVARIILWANDHLAIEMPVISAILVIMLIMALTTDLIGVHAALGAFVSGILIGQSPILTEHIENQLRGFIIAFFSPVFFAVAGLSMDLLTLLDPTLLSITLAIILIASVGKFLGALAGGTVGRLTLRESLALATGLNARGSTEVIVASIGLSMGALSHQLYTMIVAMAVATTMVMPPTLRWMIARVPMRDEETKRLDREEAEQRQSLPRMERALVYVDASRNAEMTASLAGLFAVRQNVLMTLLEASPNGEAKAGPSAGRERLEAAAAKAQAPAHSNGRSTANTAAPADAGRRMIGQLLQARSVANGDALKGEIAKGYDIAFVGIRQPLTASAPRFEEPLQGLVAGFNGPIAILINGGRLGFEPNMPLDILVPTGGRSEARLATEVALALAGASGGTLTALHVFDPRVDTMLVGGRSRRAGMSLLVDAHRLGKRSGVAVKGLTATNERFDIEIRRAVRRGRYDLVVLGASLRHGEPRFVGPGVLGLVQSLHAPVLMVAC
jgi:Kef-type K+ transport system membrane component KefB/nucleotide-binding universal stress UspA family protein